MDRARNEPASEISRGLPGADDTCREALDPLGVTPGTGRGRGRSLGPARPMRAPSDTRERARPEGRTRCAESADDQCLPVGFSTIVPESFAGLPSFGIVYAKNARPVAFLITSSTRRPKVKVREASSRIGVSMKQR